jgi:hypothetical protein
MLVLGKQSVSVSFNAEPEPAIFERAYSHKFIIGCNVGNVDNTATIKSSVLELQSKLGNDCIITITEGLGYWDKPEHCIIIEHICSIADASIIFEGKLLLYLRQLKRQYKQDSILYTRSELTLSFNVV